MFCVRLWTCGSRERGRGEGKPSPGSVPTRLDPTRGSTDFVRISGFPGKLQVAPVASLLSLVDPLAAHFRLVGTLGC